MNSSLTITLLISLIFTYVTFPHFSQLSLAQNLTSLSSSHQSTTFPKSFENLVSQAHNLTRSYQNEVAKWRTHQYDNKTMISITNSYLPKYENLVSQSRTLQPPKQLQNGTDLYTKSLESELQSYVHFKNYLSTNNSTENELSSKLLSDSFKDEIDSFKTLKSSGSFTFIL
jgi:hypothetical protein